MLDTQEKTRRREPAGLSFLGAHEVFAVLALFEFAQPVDKMIHREVIQSAVRLLGHVTPKLAISQTLDSLSP
jgi:hypothetical protein